MITHSFKKDRRFNLYEYTTYLEQNNINNVQKDEDAYYIFLTVVAFTLNLKMCYSRAITK